MPATSDTVSTNACHSFIFEKPSGKGDASKRIPRPPNAFMLYRSDFVKRGVVSPEVEKRQQNLSRIAGQCWNMLSDAEKAIWFSKAEVIRAEHRAKYPSHHTQSLYRDTNRLSTKDKRNRSATKSGRPFGRFRTRRTRTPYCEGMFSALRDSKISSQASQASPITLISASETPLSTIASLSPLSLPQLLTPFTSHTHSSKQDCPSATSDNPVIRKGKFGYPLDSPGSEAMQWGLPDIIQDLEITPSEDSSQQPYPTLQQYGDDFGLGVPYPSLEQLFEPLNDLVAQVPPTLPGSSISPPPIDHRFADYSYPNGYSVADDFAHFNQSLVP